MNTQAIVITLCGDTRYNHGYSDLVLAKLWITDLITANNGIKKRINLYNLAGEFGFERSISTEKMQLPIGDLPIPDVYRPGSWNGLPSREFRGSYAYLVSYLGLRTYDDLERLFIGYQELLDQYREVYADRFGIRNAEGRHFAINYEHLLVVIQFIPDSKSTILKQMLPVAIPEDLADKMAGLTENQKSNIRYLFQLVFLACKVLLYSESRLFDRYSPVLWLQPEGERIIRFNSETYWRALCFVFHYYRYCQYGYFNKKQSIPPMQWHPSGAINTGALHSMNDDTYALYESPDADGGDTINTIVPAKTATNSSDDDTIMDDGEETDILSMNSRSGRAPDESAVHASGDASSRDDINIQRGHAARTRETSSSSSASTSSSDSITWAEATASTIPTDFQEADSEGYSDIVNPGSKNDGKASPQFQPMKPSSSPCMSISLNFDNLEQSIMSDDGIIQENNAIDEALKYLENDCDQHNTENYTSDGKQSFPQSVTTLENDMHSDQGAVDIQLQSQADQQLQDISLSKDLMLREALDDFLSDLDAQQAVCIEAAVNLSQSLTPQDYNEDDEILLYWLILILRGIYFGICGVRPNNKTAQTFARYLRKSLKASARAIIAEAQGRGKYSRVAIKAELYAYYFELAAGIYPTSAADFEERIEEITACEINYDGDDILIDGTVEEDCEAMRRNLRTQWTFLAGDGPDITTSTGQGADATELTVG